MEKGVSLIGKIQFRDVMVGVYNNPLSEDTIVQCAWRVRNPDSYYQGPVFVDFEKGKVKYPDDSVIPEQTDEDREILPQFILTGIDKIDDEFISSVNSYLEKSYKVRNNL